MDKWQTAHGLFAYEIASGLLVWAVVSGQMSKEAATKLIDETLSCLLEGYPHYSEELREIAAKGSAQIMVLAAEAERQAKRS